MSVGNSGAVVPIRSVDLLRMWSSKMEFIAITDFKNELFADAFKQYFAEFGIHVKDWDALFEEMNREEYMGALLLVDSASGVLGFIQYQSIQLNNNFFQQKLGFVREFWVRSECRKLGYGTLLLEKVEEFFREKKHKGKPILILLSYLLTNCLTRPDFIAYNHKHADNISRRICRHLGALSVTYTVKSQAEYEQAKNKFDLFIFDSCRI